MSGKLHEGMTRTQTSVPAPRRGHATLYALLLAVTMVALIWAVVALLGEGGPEARAQTAGGGSEELAQSPSTDNEKAVVGEREPSYQAFGQKQDPFDPVVSQAETGNATAEAGAGDGSTKARSSTDNGNGGATAQEQAARGQRGGTGTPQNSADSGANGATSQNLNQAPTSTNCEKFKGFARVTCEGEQNVAGPAANNGGNGASPGGQRVVPQGGAGRSSVDEPTQTFRNGGGGVLK